MKAVDHGLYQATERLSERDRVTGKRTLSIVDRAGQIKLGNTAALEIVKEQYGDKPLNEALDADAYSRANRIFERVLAVSHMRNEDWTLILIPDDSYNAATTGGTTVIINHGMMKQAESDDEIAMIMGHELGHVAANHPFEGITHEKLSALAGSKSVRTDSFQAAFTHDAEKEADQIGLLYAALAGYDPLVARDIWQRFYAASGNQHVNHDGTPYWADHPVNGERAVQTEELAQQVMPYYIPGKQNPQFAEILEDNVFWSHQGNTDTLEAGSGGGALAALETATQAYIAHQNAKIEVARQKRRADLTRYADSTSVVLGHGHMPDGQWGMQFRYQGSMPLTYMSVVGVFQPAGQQAFQIASEVHKPVRPGEVLTVQFTDSRLTGISPQSTMIRYVVDDAADHYSQ